MASPQFLHTLQHVVSHMNHMESYMHHVYHVASHVDHMAAHVGRFLHGMQHVDHMKSDEHVDHMQSYDHVDHMASPSVPCDTFFGFSFAILLRGKSAFFPESHRSAASCDAASASSSHVTVPFVGRTN